MKAKQYKGIKEHVPSIVNYQDEVQLIETFFTKKDLNVEETTVVFWNHIITLLERIDNDEQNDLELDQTEEMSSEAKVLTDDLVEYLSRYRDFKTTDFEKYLLTIYFEQLKKEEEN